MRISFTVPAVPVAQPRQRTRAFALPSGRIGTQNYMPRKDPVNAFKAAVMDAAKRAYDGPPSDRPCSIKLVCILPRPKRLIWKRRAMPRQPHAAKPDLDNLEKAVKDALSRIIWRDDCQVCHVEKDKCYASGDEAPHVEITVWDEAQEAIEEASCVGAAEQYHEAALRG